MITNRNKLLSYGGRTLAIALTGLMLIASCKNSIKKDNESDVAKGDFTIEKNIVDTIILRRQDFKREVVSNGKLLAMRRANLSFKGQGEIARVNYKNGDYVRKGDTIASLNTITLKLKLSQAEQTFEKAKLDFTDNLIGFGYGVDTNKIPEDKIKVAGTRSGILSARQNIIAARYDLSNAVIIAPFNGLVANLNAKPFEQSNGIICTVIDASIFDVKFCLLESELNYIKKGQDIRLVPFIDPSTSYIGNIKEINPLIDNNGQVKIIASLPNRAGKLIEGQNVKIFIESNTHNRLVVPKSAVVIRDGYDVIFTLNLETMRTGWVYVDIIESNSTCHVIDANKQKQSTLKEGDIIITTGNLNLADGSKVIINK